MGLTPARAAKAASERSTAGVGPGGEGDGCGDGSDAGLGEEPGGGGGFEQGEVHPKPWRVPYAASRLKAAVS